MKFKLIALSATLLLITGCSTTFSNYYGNFKSECRNLPENYINQEYIEEYKKSKSIYFEGVNNTCSDVCHLLSKMERWDYIEVYLINSDYDFPYENNNFYKLYRDYDMKNCMPRRLTSPIIYENSKGKFCLTAELIKEKTADFSYGQGSNIKHKTKTSIIRENIATIKYKNVDVVKVKSFSFNSSSMNDSCSIEDNVERIIIQDFSY